jgi:hypothetical protein
MKRLTIVAMVLAAGLGAARCGDDEPNNPTGPSNTGPIVFSVQLSAANEVPPISNAESNARGTATITFNVPRDASGAITGGGNAVFAVQMNSFPAGSVARAAHIHPGAAGVNGGVLVDTGLTPASPVTMDANGAGSFNLTQSNLSQADATAITANPGGYYFNVHSNLNTGGVIRGQLVRQ